MYKSQLPVLVICQLCNTSNNKDCNVLLYSDYKNYSLQLRSALTKFLYDYEEGVAINVFTLGLQKLSEAEQPVQKIVNKEDSKVFTVSSGDVLKKEDVLHRIHDSPKEDALYLLQQLSFNGRPVTVLYDSGASSSWTRNVGKAVV